LRFAAAASPGAEGIAWRLVLPMVNQSARVIDEGIVESTEAIDLATVLGLGLAPFRGGLVQFARSVGLPELTSRLNDQAAIHGPRFAPSPALAELIEPPVPAVIASVSPMGGDDRPLPLDNTRISFSQGGSHAHIHT
jgi:hypothetical protein